LNRPLREQLKKQCMITQLAIRQCQPPMTEQKKLLFRLDDGNAIEGVLIPGGQANALRLIAGGLRIGLRLLPHRSNRARPELA
jgi:adenine C2-methylase RlmN of 23S rRNA A2503 and tRNA A37